MMIVLFLPRKVRYFLGIEVVQLKDDIGICQRKYATEILERFKMVNCNSVQIPMKSGCRLEKDMQGEQVDSTTYKQLVGCLMYITATRPDLMYSVSSISRYMTAPTQLHWQAANRILRYLEGTINLGIMCKKGVNKEVLGFTDSDYAGDVEDRKSTSGYTFMLSDGAVAWSSRKQPIVTLSSTEAEFLAACSVACQAIWMQILKEIDQLKDTPITLMCDNTSTIKLSRNPILHARSKHIEVRFHYLRELVKNGKIKMEYCGTKDQIADLLTKPVSEDTFLRLRKIRNV